MQTIYGSGGRREFWFPPVVSKLLRLPLPYFLFLLTLTSFIVVGCAGFKTNNMQEFNLMITSRTPLYKTGPSQNVPDTYLEEGTRIRMIRAEGDFVLVETTYGLQGYVSGDCVKVGGQEPPRNSY